MPRLPERQVRINSQLTEDLTDVKTRQLFCEQALGAVAELLDGLLERMAERGIVAADDSLLTDYRKAIDPLRRQGLRLEPPEDPDARVPQVTCPSCRAVIKSKGGKRVARCDWCGGADGALCEVFHNLSPRLLPCRSGTFTGGKGVSSLAIT